MDILKRWGLDQVLVNSSADWGVSDPCSLPKVARFMQQQGFTTQQVQKLLFDNPLAFYSQCDKFKPNVDLPCQDPAVYQR
ncbi:MAG: hypothetical protein NTV49_09545 [Kiritimatiellaeota bacterium]|nr:hypothetical protein [Kiritimatiellota bacterium]